MDLIADNWKKYPLLLIGELGIVLPEALPFPLSGIGAPGGFPINDFYILVAAPEAELLDTLARLESANVCPAQILLFLKPETAFSHPKQAFLGLFDLIEGESSEEFRTRLLGKLEGQRQKILCHALQESADLGIARQLGEKEFSTALDSCRLAHALACSFSLPPLTHLRVLRTCLELTPAAKLPWPSDTSTETLVVETSLLLLDCIHRELSFRELLKEKSAALPFRVRNDLLHHIETSLGQVLGGKSHAA